jgi:hypothetical protein
MSEKHTLLESLSSDPNFTRIINKYKRKPSGGRSSNDAYNSKNNGKPPGGRRTRASSNPPDNGGGIGKYLLALGAGGAGGYALRDKLGDDTGEVGEAMHSLRDKLGDVANNTGEHISSLRDKLANIIATHHDDEA